MPGPDAEQGMDQPLQKSADAQASGPGIAATFKKPDFLVTWAVPFLTHTAVILLYTFGFMKIPFICVLVSVLLFFGGTALISLRSRGHLWMPLGVSTVTAVVVATALGLYIEDQYAVFPWFYQNARTYTDVVPSQPARSVEDAGKIGFALDSHVDTAHSVGYVTEDGHTYCIAPVRDNTTASRVEFWAVGLGCCAERGGFWCDQVGDASAKGGIRVFDNGGWFASANLDNYQLARMKAEATWGLLSSGAGTLYVRWVREDNLDMLTSFYRKRMIIALCIFIIVYLGGSAALALALYAPRPKPKRFANP